MKRRASGLVRQNEVRSSASPRPAAPARALSCAAPTRTAPVPCHRAAARGGFGRIMNNLTPPPSVGPQHLQDAGAEMDETGVTSLAGTCTTRCSCSRAATSSKRRWETISPKCTMNSRSRNGTPFRTAVHPWRTTSISRVIQRHKRFGLSGSSCFKSGFRFLKINFFVCFLFRGVRASQQLSEKWKTTNRGV
jgi:hypothetical protein